MRLPQPVNITDRSPVHRLEIISEIRAVSIDAELAELFAAAGFSWFEIGLQSTNSRALQIMNRPTHLEPIFV